MHLKFILFVLTSAVTINFAVTESFNLLTEEAHNERAHVRPKRTILVSKKTALIGGAAALIGGKALLAKKAIIAKKALLVGAGVGGAALIGTGVYRALS